MATARSIVVGAERTDSLPEETSVTDPQTKRVNVVDEQCGVRPPSSRRIALATFDL